MTISVDEKVKETIGPALGKIASGVYIVTIGDGNERDGMLTTWINQASFNPPCVSVAVNKERAIHPKMTKDALFGVNVLSKENMDIFKSFAKPHEEGLDRFKDLDVANDIEGPPAFSKAVSYLKCKVKSTTDAGDHDIVIAEIVDAKLLNDELEPMTHIRKNGFQY